MKRRDGLSTYERLQRAVERIDARERFGCCGETFVGALAAENHITFMHAQDRSRARELVAMASREPSR